MTAPESTPVNAPVEAHGSARTVVVCADRGSPGATTTALALAAATPTPTVLVEADPYGGDLAIRCRSSAREALRDRETVLTALVAARTGASATLLASRATWFTPGLGLVPGPLSAEQWGGVTDWSPLVRAMGSSSTPIVADVGRIHHRSPSMPLAAAADMVVVVARGDLAGMIHLRDRLSHLAGTLSELRGAPARILPVLITPHRHGPSLTEQFQSMILGTSIEPVVDQVGWITWDPATVNRLEAGAEVDKKLSRSQLLRSALRVAEAAGLPTNLPTDLPAGRPDGIAAGDDTGPGDTGPASDTPARTGSFLRRAERPGATTSATTDHVVGAGSTSTETDTDIRTETGEGDRP